MHDDKRRIRLLITGRVQGVGYRYGVLQIARELGLAGWVRNRPDGSVEVTAEGAPAEIAALRAWCREGPPLARVAAMHEEEGVPCGELPPFEVR